jgi:hypothetical protein
MFTNLWNAVKNVAKKVVDVVKITVVKVIDFVKAFGEVLLDLWLPITAGVLTGYLYGANVGFGVFSVILFVQICLPLIVYVATLVGLCMFVRLSQ